MSCSGNWAWERVLINLFLNSMRAMPRGGVIEVHASSSSQEIHILVRDSGSGILPLEIVLERLFEPGVSTNSSHGLGLCMW